MAKGKATDNLVLIEDEELKARLFDILCFLKEVCDEEGIPYSLSDGTLLGAIRHKGFIPWDDDVDVCLLRRDIPRLIEAIKKRNHPRFDILSEDTNDTYYYSYPKIVDKETDLYEHGYRHIRGYGLHVDVFPLDICPDEDDAFIRYAKKHRHLRMAKTVSVFNGINKHKSFAYHVAMVLLKPFAGIPGFKHWLKKIRKLCATQKEPTGYVCCMFYNVKPKNRLPEDCMEGLVEVPFETGKFSAFRFYDAYLTQTYGDYMTPPPPEKRGIQHNFSAYRRADAPRRMPLEKNDKGCDEN